MKFKKTFESFHDAAKALAIYPAIYFKTAFDIPEDINLDHYTYKIKIKEMRVKIRGMYPCAVTIKLVENG